MKLLITGGAGFIGSHFLRYILKARPQVEVINFDLLTYAGNLENLSDIKDNPRKGVEACHCGHLKSLKELIFLEIGMARNYYCNG